MNKNNRNKALQISISPQRLHRFLLKANGDLGKAIELYEENARLSAEFYSLLSCFEVCVRNQINEIMKEKYGDGWLLEAKTPLQKKHREDIQKVCDRLRRKGKIVGKNSEDMGRIVADLPLGFWVKLLTRGYSHSLWSATLRHAFPNYKGDLKSLSYKIHRIWLLRNRVAHHEPIIFQNGIEGMRDEILEVIGWMCKDTREWVAALRE